VQNYLNVNIHAKVWPAALATIPKKILRDVVEQFFGRWPHRSEIIRDRNRRLPSRRFNRRNPRPRYELDRANTGPLANAGMRRGYDLRVCAPDPGRLGQRLNIRNFVKAPLGHRSSRSAFNSLNFLR
jgi:hypothetical protein